MKSRQLWVNSMLSVLLAAGCTPVTIAPTASSHRTGLPPTYVTAATSAQILPTQVPPLASPTPMPADALRGTLINVWHPWSGVEAAVFAAQIAEFNRDNQWGITVQPSGLSGYAELYHSVTASLGMPDQPDLAIGRPEYGLAWDQKQNVIDPTGYIADPVVGWTMAEVADFPDSFWSGDATSAKRYGVPAERTLRVMLYNETVAKRLGFAAPPQNSGDFEEQACAAHKYFAATAETAHSNEGGWLVDIDGLTLLAWFRAFKGGVLNDGNYNFESTENLEALKFIKGLFDQGCSWVAASTEDPASVFGAGRALFVTASVEQLPEFSRAMAAGAGDRWHVLAFPGSGGSSSISDGSSYIIMKSNADRQLASWLFEKWMLMPEHQAEWVNATGQMALRKSVLPLVGDYAHSHPQWTAAQELISSSEASPIGPNWRAVRTMMGDGFQAMYLVNTPIARLNVILQIMQSTAQELAQ